MTFAQDYLGFPLTPIFVIERTIKEQTNKQTTKELFSMKVIESQKTKIRHNASLRSCVWSGFLMKS
jgi:hypothetical protein